MKKLVNYEPKSVNRWNLTMITTTSEELGSKLLPEFVVSETNRPKFKRERYCLFWSRLKPDTIHIEMIDPISPSTSQVIYNLIECDFKLDYNLEMLDPTGVVVEKWEVRGCEILEANFGQLDYNNDSLVHCSLIIKPNTAKLVF